MAAAVDAVANQVAHPAQQPRVVLHSVRVSSSADAHDGALLYHHADPVAPPHGTVALMWLAHAQVDLALALSYFVQILTPITGIVWWVFDDCSSI